LISHQATELGKSFLQMVGETYGQEALQGMDTKKVFGLMRENVQTRIENEWFPGLKRSLTEAEMKQAKESMHRLFQESCEQFDPRQNEGGVAQWTEMALPVMVLKPMLDITVPAFEHMDRWRELSQQMIEEIRTRGMEMERQGDERILATAAKEDLEMREVTSLIITEGLPPAAQGGMSE
jgi:hypothetical protein